MWISVLVCLGCSNKNDINQMAYVVLIVLGAEGCNMEMLAALVSSTFSVSYLFSSLYAFTWWNGVREFLVSLIVFYFYN